MATQTNRILVVDDELAAGKSIEKILSKRGFQVDIAMSADDGINKIEKGLFELVLLDIMMPQVSGIECLKIIKERWPKLNVVMITGYPSIDTAVQATRLGALDYIPKPFTPQELREKVDDALRTRGPAQVIPLIPVERSDTAFAHWVNRCVKSTIKRAEPVRPKTASAPKSRRKG